jgi:translation initiation factor 2 alpha subunit (eIF-2alpha)
MNKHLLSLVENKKKVISIEKNFSYSFDVKKKIEKIDVSRINIYDKDMMSNYASYKLEKKFKKLVSLVREQLDSDDSEDSCMECLGMISKYEDMLANEYKHYLKVQKYKEFITKVTLLRDYVEAQIVALNQELEYNVKGGR